MKFLSVIAIISIWLSRIGITFSLLTILVPQISDINYDSSAVFLGIPAMLIGILSLSLGLLGMLKPHEKYQNARKGFKNGIWTLLILILGFGGGLLMAGFGLRGL